MAMGVNGMAMAMAMAMAVAVAMAMASGSNGSGSGNGSGNAVSTNLSTLPYGLEWGVVTPEKRICQSCKNLPIGRVCDFPVKRQVFVTLCNVKVWQSCAAMNS